MKQIPNPSVAPFKPLLIGLSSTLIHLFTKFMPDDLLMLGELGSPLPPRPIFSQSCPLNNMRSDNKISEKKKEVECQRLEKVEGALQLCVRNTSQVLSEVGTGCCSNVGAKQEEVNCVWHQAAIRQ